MTYTVKQSSKFKRDYRRMLKRGIDPTPLFSVIATLKTGQPLEPSHQDHFLTGNYQGLRECHIKPDWLLVYGINEKTGVLVLSRTGTHTDLFG